MARDQRERARCAVRALRTALRARLFTAAAVHAAFFETSKKGLRRERATQPSTRSFFCTVAACACTLFALRQTNYPLKTVERVQTPSTCEESRTTPAGCTVRARRTTQSERKHPTTRLVRKVNQHLTIRAFTDTFKMTCGCEFFTACSLSQIYTNATAVAFTSRCSPWDATNFPVA
jgi:hypothetical protein